MKRALFPGSFDPVTLGHLDLIKRGSQLFDELIVVLLVNQAKTPLFTLGERVALLEKACADLPNVKIHADDLQLLGNVAQALDCQFILRGLRNHQDLTYEDDLASLNRQLFNGLETVFLLADDQFRHVSSSAVKEIVSFGGDASQFVLPEVQAQLKVKLGGKQDA